MQPRSTERIRVKKFEIVHPKVSEATSTFYRSLGLDTKIEHGRLNILSTKFCHILSRTDPITVKILNRDIVKGLNEQQIDTGELLLFDDLGHKVLATFRATSIKKIAVLTSGGDSPGMNGAIRAIVKKCHKMGITVFGVYFGYDGLINGKMTRLMFDSVGYHSQHGGTFLLSARSMAFKTREGRKEAAFQLASRGIEAIIVMGGDGSMTGSISLHHEYGELVEELAKEGRLVNREDKNSDEACNEVGSQTAGAQNDKQQLKHSNEDTVSYQDTRTNHGDDMIKIRNHLAKTKVNGKASHLSTQTSKSNMNPSIQMATASITLVDKLFDTSVARKYTKTLKIIAIPGSIDNDIPFTDMTLGADSCLHRAIDAIDCLESTMVSHQRAFIVEVMGRNCGWIAIQCAMASGADFVFLPEAPIQDWQAELKKSVKRARDAGKLGTIVILSEGAVDTDGKRIPAGDVKAVLDKMSIETRIQKLGHIQRGGKPSAFDRIFSTMLGLKAVEELQYDCADPVMVGLIDGKYQSIDLQMVIDRLALIDKCHREMNWNECIKLRGPIFVRMYKMCEQLRLCRPANDKHIDFLAKKIPDISSSSDKNAELQNQMKFAEQAKHPKSKISNKTFERLRNVDQVIGAKHLSIAAKEEQKISETKDKNEHIDRQQGHTTEKHDYLKESNTQTSIRTNKPKLLVIHHGPRAGGMNVSLHVIVRYAMSLDQNVYIAQEGFVGLCNDQLYKTEPYEYITGLHDGGSFIGSSEEIKSSGEILSKLQEHSVDRLVVIGGIEALKVVRKLKERMADKRKQHKKQNAKDEQSECLNDPWNVNVILIPTSIENCIPYTDMCIGADTALNCIVVGSDFLRLSSMAMKKTAFVVEVHGELTGYLACLGGLAAGAFETFIPERHYKICHLSETAERLAKRFERGNRHGILIMKSKNTFEAVTVEAFSKLLATDSDLFNAKYCSFGYLLQGGNPSPYDRVCATVLGMKAVDLLLNTDLEKIVNTQHFCGVLGLKGQEVIFTDAQKAYARFRDIQVGKCEPRWMKYANICRSLE